MSNEPETRKVESIKRPNYKYSDNNDWGFENENGERDD